MTPNRPYHQVMEGNTPPDRGPHTTNQSAPAPYNGAPPPPWPPQAHPYPTAPAVRSGNSLWIIFAGIIIAGALIAGAAFLALDGKDAPAPTASSTAPPAPSNGPLASPSAADSSTCQAWRTTVPAIRAIPDLPAGWDWDMPNIDTYIANHNASVGKVLDLFEPKIAAEPSNVAAAANDFVSARRNEMRLLANHTYRGADGVAGNIAFEQLNQLCDVTG